MARSIMLKAKLGQRAIATLAGIAVAVTLAGCVGIPDSGPVSEGVSLADGGGASNVEFNPDGPQKGAPQASILRGFVAAFTSATGGYAVAKQFLSASFQDKWDPRASVKVRTGAPRLSSIDDTTIDYSFATVATVDQNGAYSQAAGSSSLQFSFVQERGQWRISAAPAGIVLPEQTFERIFIKRPLYFLDPAGQNLVPDLRWFPNGTAPTRIVSALLQGPPDWLKGAVRTEFPDGTALTDSGAVVTVDAGVARIDLTKEASTANPLQRQLMRLQLLQSLRTVGSISNVSITVQGTLLAIDDTDSNLPTADNKVNDQALVLRKGEFGSYANNKIAAIPLSNRIVALAPLAVTLSSDEQTAAVLGKGTGVSIVRRGIGASAPVDTRPGLIAPSMDENGFVWSVPASSPNDIHVYDNAGVVHNVNPQLPQDTTIVSLEVSRDGARVAVLLSTATGPRLIVAAILRDADQKQAPFVPVALGPPILDVPIANGLAVDTTWVDQLTVATLVTVGTQSSVELFTIGGQTTALDSLPMAQEIVGGNGEDGLRVLADDSTIYTYHGSSWQSSKVMVDFIGTRR